MHCRKLVLEKKWSRGRTGLPQQGFSQVRVISTVHKIWKKCLKAGKTQKEAYVGPKTCKPRHELGLDEKTQGMAHLWLKLCRLPNDPCSSTSVYWLHCGIQSGSSKTLATNLLEFHVQKSSKAKCQTWNLQYQKLPNGGFATAAITTDTHSFSKSPSSPQ